MHLHLINLESSKTEWGKLTVKDTENIFAVWKKRLRLVAEMYGEHIEQTKKIHRRRV